MYINEIIPVKQLYSHKDDSKTLFPEISLRLRKRLIVGANKPPDQSKSVLLESLSKSRFIYLGTCENVILLGFNMTPEHKNLQLFADSFNSEHLIKKPTCFEVSPPCINLIITNRKAYLKKACILETGISDFLKLTAVSLKSQILKAPPKWKLYRDYKAFVEKSFNNDFKTKLDPIKILDYSCFEDIFISVLKTYDPARTKIIRANSHEFMTKAHRKAIVTRSRLKNVYLKNQNAINWSNYKYQRSFCTNLLPKTKFDYFRNLNVKELNDNKNSGKKSNLSFQIKVSQVVTLFWKKKAI